MRRALPVGLFILIVTSAFAGDNLLLNGDFSSNTSNWKLSCGAGAFAVQSGQAVVTAGNDNVGHCQLFQSGLDIQPPWGGTMGLTGRREAVGGEAQVYRMSSYQTLDPIS